MDGYRTMTENAGSKISCQVQLSGRTEKRHYLGAADKAASLMGCKSPTANCPIRAVSISDVWRGNEPYEARK